MADDIRRSGRATKGQNTKPRDIDEAPAKKKGKGKNAKAKQVEEEEEEDYVRCICGQYEEEEEEPRDMICCDNCTAWQHNDCMGLPPGYSPDSYFCEECKPENHKDLVARMKRGEKPWEEVARQREAAQAGKKKGKKSRKSGVANEVQEAATPAAGQKRKAEDSPAASDIKVNKKARGTPAAEANGKSSSARKLSATPSRQASGVVGDVKDLPGGRKPMGQTLVKAFIEATELVVKSKDYSVPSGQTLEGFVTPIALAVEQAIYQVRSGGAGAPNESHRNHVRALLTNLKKNGPLTVRVLTGQVSPDELAGMDAKDLASEEQKKLDAALRAEQDKQHIIVGETNQGPRVRRTHKGEEYVDEALQLAPESTSQPARKQKQEDVKSPEIKSPTAPARRQPSVTIPRRQSGDPRRQSSTNFDINKVWSNVQGSPDADQQRFGDLPQQGTTVNEPAGPGARADADIDELLKDEEVESPPYSPKDDSSNEGVVWRGVINGGNLGRFHTSARYACGATPDNETLQTTWSSLLPNEIGIGGRIQPAKADEYLCGLEWSNSSDLLIIWMHEPETTGDLEQFNKFFSYFKAKGRFGVGQQHHNSAVKDIYFVPLDHGQEMPAFVRKLEGDWPDHATERMLLVPLVVRNSELPHSDTALEHGQTGSQLDGAPLQSPAVHQTPITPRDEWQTPVPGPNGGPGPAILHHTQNGGYPPNYASPPLPYSAVTHPPQLPASQPPAAPPAAIAAHRILGAERARLPAVLQLIASAPTAGDQEMSVVRECIDNDEQAGLDLSVLTKMLQEKHQRQQDGPTAGAGQAMEGVGNAPARE